MALFHQAPQRNKVMRGTETLNRASESIARSTRVAVETGRFINTQIQGCTLAGILTVYKQLLQLLKEDQEATMSLPLPTVTVVPWTNTRPWHCGIAPLFWEVPHHYIISPRGSKGTKKEKKHNYHKTYVSIHTHTYISL